MELIAIMNKVKMSFNLINSIIKLVFRAIILMILLKKNANYRSVKTGLYYKNILISIDLL